MAVILADDIFKCIFLNENDIHVIPIQISLKFVPRSPIANKATLVQEMVWRQTDDKPLSEPIMNRFIDVYMQHWGGGYELNTMRIGDAFKHQRTGAASFIW